MNCWATLHGKERLEIVTKTGQGLNWIKLY